MPSRKNVARTRSSSSRSRIAPVCRSSAGPRLSQSASPSRRCTSWCQSSKSMLSRTLATIRTLRRSLATPTREAMPALPAWPSKAVACDADQRGHAGFAGVAVLISARLVKLLPTVLVLVLLGATAAAFTVTQRLKLEDSPILGVQLDQLVSPVCTVCKQPEAREAVIRFRLREEDDVRIDIVHPSGTILRDGLVIGHYEPQSLRFSWDGRDSRGRVVADGLYRVRVKLDELGRTLEFPQEIRVDATVPTVEEIRVHPALFSPDGDGRSDLVNVVYRFSEGAFPVLYVDGKRSGPGFRRRPTGVMQWYALR